MIDAIRWVGNLSNYHGHNIIGSSKSIFPTKSVLFSFETQAKLKRTSSEHWTSDLLYLNSNPSLFTDSDL